MGCYGCHGVVVGPAATTPVEVKKDAEPVKESGEKKGEEMGQGPAPAIILVSLPADAQLTIDDYATTSTSASRRFVSPALKRGQDYHYTLTAKLTRDGKPVSTTKRIAVRAGEETRVSLEFPTATVAAK
jgi:uncharacterized protein (TIGR03000 family)